MEVKSLKIEIRSDGAHISGYVNATEKKSRPVMTPHGRVIEVIEPRAFERAINRAGNITLTVDHTDQVYADTEHRTLELREDAIGLHADALVSDPAVIDLARQGRIRGWSFGMANVQDELEPRADDLPLRHVKDLDLDHVTLVVNKSPVYSATSVEVRADAEICVETRSTVTEAELIEEVKTQDPEPAPAPVFDNTAYRKRIETLKLEDEK